jgi:polynucleotide 5'-hydroxyl-kinase GRC3/NOL9
VATDQPSIVVPWEWRRIDARALRGVVMVAGGPDTGKSTFAGWLFEQLAEAGRSVALLDGDVGQSALGPPTMMTVGLPREGVREPRELRERVHWFVGDTSPRGHMLPLVVGAGRLARRALEAGAGVVLMDTTGLVDRSVGGVALKHALVDELQPATVFAFQRNDELAPILAPLQRLPRLQLVRLHVPDAVQRRSTEARQAHRAEAFRRHFRDAQRLRLSLHSLAVFEGHGFAPRRVLALRDEAGFALALGVIEAWDPSSGTLSVHTPLREASQVASIHLGVIGVEVDTGRDFRPGRR